jgi:hypothetical protein
MNKQQLNAAILKMAKDITLRSDKSEGDLDNFFKYVDKVFKPEFIRLYQLDRKFELMNKRSVLIMFRLNLRYRVIDFHNFGNEIELP